MAAFGQRLALTLALATFVGIPSTADVREVRLGVKGAT